MCIPSCVRPALACVETGQIQALRSKAPLRPVTFVWMIRLTFLVYLLKKTISLPGVLISKRGQAVFQMEHKMELGPARFLAEFYQRFCKLIEGDDGFQLGHRHGRFPAK